MAVRIGAARARSTTAAVDVLVVVGVAADGADRRPPTDWPTCSTPTTSPTGWRSSPPGTPDEQQRRRARRLRQPRPPRRAELRRRVARVHPAAPRPRRRPPTPAASAPPSGCAAPRIETTLGRIAGARRGRRGRWPRRCRPRCGRRPGATTSSQFTTLDDAGTRAGSATTPVATCARPVRCRRCAAGASPTACCPSRRSPAGRPPATTPRPARRLRQLLGDAARPGVAAGDDRRRPRRAQRRSRRRRRRRAPRRTPPAPATHVRRALGPHYLRHLRRFLGEDLDAIGFFARLRQLTSNLPDRVGAARSGRVSTCSCTRTPARRSACRSCPRRRRHARLPRRAARRRPGRPRRAGARPPCRCCRRWLRHALLREHAEAAARLLAAAGRDATELRVDAELVDLVPAPSADRHAGPGSAPSRCRVPPTARTVGEHLGRLDRLHRPRGATARRAPRGADARSPPPTPPRSSGSCPPRSTPPSYRLDAWVTSLAAPTPRRAAGRRSRRVWWSAATAGSRVCATSPATRSPSSPPTSPGRCSPPPTTPASSSPRRSTRRARRPCCARPTSPTAARRQPVRHQADVGPGAPRRAPVRRRAPGHPARRAARLRRRAAAARGRASTS